MEDWQNWLKNKRVVFFVAETVPSIAGSGINAFRFAKYLCSYTKQVKIVCFNYNNKLPKYELIEGVVIKRIRYYNKSLSSKLLSLPFLIYNYCKETILCNISFVYGAYMPGYETILFVSWLFGKKTIFQSTLLEDDDIESILNKKPKSLRIIKKSLFKKISVYYAINKRFEEKCINSLGKKVNIILRTQGVNAEGFAPQDLITIKSIKNLYNIKDNKFVILSVGILIKRKGYLDIFQYLKELPFPFIYIVAGLDHQDIYHRSSDQELKEMELIKTTGKTILGDKVQFLGHINDLKKIYSIANVYLHCATQEGTPGAILEAMSSRLPVVMRKIEGTEFIFKNEENCLIFNHPNESISCLTRIHNEFPFIKRLTENAHNRILTFESFEMISALILNVLYGPPKKNIY